MPLRFVLGKCDTLSLDRVGDNYGRPIIAKRLAEKVAQGERIAAIAAKLQNTLKLANLSPKVAPLQDDVLSSVSGAPAAPLCQASLDPPVVLQVPPAAPLAPASAPHPPF